MLGINFTVLIVFVNVVGRMHVVCPTITVPGGSVSFRAYSSDGTGWKKLGPESEEVVSKNANSFDEALSTLDEIMSPHMGSISQHIQPIVRKMSSMSGIPMLGKGLLGSSLLPSSIIPSDFDDDAEDDRFHNPTPKSRIPIPISQPGGKSAGTDEYGNRRESIQNSVQNGRPVSPTKIVPTSPEQRRTNYPKEEENWENEVRTPPVRDDDNIDPRTLQKLKSKIPLRQRSFSKSSDSESDSTPGAGSRDWSAGNKNTFSGGNSNLPSIIVDGSLPPGTPQQITIRNDKADPPSLPRPWKVSKRTQAVNAPWVPTNFDYNLHKDAVLERQNLYRQRHHAPDLVYDVELSRLSQIHANEIIRSNQLIHKKIGYGENLAWGGVSYEKPPYTRVDAWYNEIKFYNFATGPVSGPATGHFTQLVWKSSRKVGIGIAIQNGYVSVVCYYSPGGNDGTYIKNVLPE